jgi:hypothetical protein
MPGKSNGIVSGCLKHDEQGRILDVGQVRVSLVPGLRSFKPSQASMLDASKPPLLVRICQGDVDKGRANMSPGRASQTPCRVPLCRNQSRRQAISRGRAPSSMPRPASAR